MPAEVVKALKVLPRAEAIQLVSDVPRDNASYIIRSVCSCKGTAIGRDGKLHQSADDKVKVVWKLKLIVDHYQIVNAANGLVLDGSGDRPAQKRASCATRLS